MSINIVYRWDCQLCVELKPPINGGVVRSCTQDGHNQLSHLHAVADHIMLHVVALLKEKANA